MAVSWETLTQKKRPKPPAILMYGPEKAGKEQPLTARILTPTGWSTMGEMEVGSAICGADGRVYHVEGVYPQGVKPAYRLTFTDGTTAEAGADHLWKVARKISRDGWLIRTTAQLMAGNSRGRDCRKFKIPVMEAAQFGGSPALPLDPYVLGALIGDGCMSSDRVCFSVPAAKEAIRQRVEEAVGEGYHLAVSHAEASAPQWFISANDRSVPPMHRIMASLGLDVKSPDRFLPDAYKLASITDRMELLRGLMDTDGSCVAGGTNLRSGTKFHTVSRRLADDVCDLVRSLGGIAVLVTQDRGAKGTEYAVRVSMTECPFSLPYKADKWLPSKMQFGKHIASIEYIGDVEQQCIKVSAPDSLYVTDGYNVTHNTTLASEFPNACFLQTEEGDGVLELDSMGKVESFADLMEAIGMLYEKEHAYQTVVVDSVTALQRLIWEETGERGDDKGNKKKRIEDFGYGKGYIYALAVWQEVLDGLNALRRDRGMTIILIAHSKIERFDDPETVGYSRYEIDLHDKARDFLKREADVVLLVKPDVTVKQEDAGFNRTRAIAQGGRSVWMHATSRPAFAAGNRYGLPEKTLYEPGKGFSALAPFFPHLAASDAAQLAAE